MENIYHKGRYKSEWWKHLRPYLKRVGNKRWRKDARLQIAEEMELTDLGVPAQKIRKKDKIVTVKFTLQSSGDRTYSYKKTYNSMKAVEQAIKRAHVIRTTVFEKRSKIERK